MRLGPRRQRRARSGPGSWAASPGLSDGGGRGGGRAVRCGACEGGGSAAAHWLAGAWERMRSRVPTPRGRAASVARRPARLRAGLGGTRVAARPPAPGAPRPGPEAHHACGRPGDAPERGGAPKGGDLPGVRREAWDGAHGRGTQPQPGPQPSKPGMEKRRRAPVSESLAQLSALILDAFRKGVSRGREVRSRGGGGGRGRLCAPRGCRPPTPPLLPECRRSKLETADTLEMAVAHLQSLRRVQVTGEARAGGGDASAQGLRCGNRPPVPCRPRGRARRRPRGPGQVPRRPQ